MSGISLIRRDLKILAITLISHFYRRNDNLWILGEWFGKRCCDNSLYLANYISNNHPEISVVWFSDKNTDLSLLNSKIQVVEMDSKEAIEISKRAGVAVMNQGFVDFSNSYNYHFAGALTVNLWHGVPWKKIFNDAIIERNALKNLHAFIINNLCKSDLYLATSDEFQKILMHSNNLRESNIIKSGYPRNSIFYDDLRIKSYREALINLIRNEVEMPLENEIKIITYMPTFRDNVDSVFSFQQLEDNEKFLQLLDQENAIIIEKGHFITRNRLGEPKSKNSPRILTLSAISAQELLAASDILITDYSSCFFDFLLLDKPIIHYIYDYDYYATKDRGLYYKKENVVCGDSVQSIEDLIQSIADNLTQPLKECILRKNRKKQYLSYESSDSCETIFRTLNKVLQR